MPPKFTSRQLAYEAPPIPSFLKALHGQVNQSRGNIDDKRGGRAEVSSEFDELLGIDDSAERGHREGNNGSGHIREEDEEWDGAQVVVLKEGKHLSKEEAGRINEKKEEIMPAAEKQGPVARAEGKPSSSASKRRTIGSEAGTTEGEVKNSSGMNAAKIVIAANKTSKERQEVKEDDDEEAQERSKRKSEKDKVKQERNKRARIEKSKTGKGLSFSMEEDR